MNPAQGEWNDDRDQVWHFGVAGDCGRGVYRGQYPPGGGGDCRLCEDATGAASGAGRHDPRFLGESFVDVAARVLAGAGITPIIIPDPANACDCLPGARTEGFRSDNFTASITIIIFWNLYFLRSSIYLSNQE